MIIGYTIVLAAWLLIDYGIRSLVEDSPDFGPWNTLACVEQPEYDLNRAIQYVDLGGSLGMFGLTQVVPGNFGVNSGAGPLRRCEVAATGPCSVSALQQAGFGRHAENAARLAGSESGCNPGAESRTDTTADRRTYSVGTWQINLAAHPVQCTLSNGQTVNLNCPSAFTEAGYRNEFNVRVQRVTNESLYQQCVQAAKDPACNNQIAARLANRSGDMGDWACSARACGVATSRNHLCPLR
jgi:hypothetical protein